MLLKIVVCTYNRAGLLSKCLESLRDQISDESLEAEVLVVDNNSTDNTREVVTANAARSSRIRYTTEAEQGLSAARNRGFAESQGEYLTYIDDDASAPSRFVWDLVQIIHRHRPDIVGGPIYPAYAEARPRWFLDKFERRCYADVSGFSTRCRVSGGNFTIRRASLQRLSGFDVKLGMVGAHVRLGEEAKVLDLYRLSTPVAEQRVYYALECGVNHYVPVERMTAKYVVQRGYSMGQMKAQLANLQVRVRGRCIVVWTVAGLLASANGFVFGILHRQNLRATCIDFARSMAIALGRAREGVRIISQRRREHSGRATS
jgi:glycosyltransferase involved in cell wall biosynthesis